jgi:hypothetical protein
MQVNRAAGHFQLPGKDRLRIWHKMNPRHNSDDLGMLSLCSATFFPTAFKNHIGFYPAPTGIERFKKELSAYKGAKGSVRFPLDEPIRYALIN